ncbi:hypothetical protein HMPREF1249_0651 [Jonquetella sp. BV3C21]|nr:hypothetical protein HMPREF1249_0651 [Jonquetella sp. BV3C21]
MSIATKVTASTVTNMIMLMTTMTTVMTMRGITTMTMAASNPPVPGRLLLVALRPNTDMNTDMGMNTDTSIGG